MNSQEPIILAVDTSCDDTAAAVIQGRMVLSNVIASQTQLHKQYGGVFPTVAKQAHTENILPTIHAALKKAQMDLTTIDALAVTVGPGLAPALEVGITVMKNLAKQYALPLIAVNHIEGHALSAIAQRLSLQKRNEIKTKEQVTYAANNQHSFIDTHKNIKYDKVRYPILSVVVSGGHTQFIYFEEIGTYQILGTTIDDAAGECLDKIGRMLHLGYPAGPIIEKFAKLGNPQAITFPLPMTSIKTYDMSFSGMKTFARNYIQKITEKRNLTKQEIYDFCASAQYAVFRHINYKLNKLLIDVKVNEIWLGGGVAQNNFLRRSIRETIRLVAKTKGNKKIKFRYPFTKKLCMDNAAMIGLVANFKFSRGEFVSNLEVVDRRPRWEIGTCVAKKES